MGPAQLGKSHGSPRQSKVRERDGSGTNSGGSGREREYNSKSEMGAGGSGTRIHGSRREREQNLVPCRALTAVSVAGVESSVSGLGSVRSVTISAS